MVHATAQNTFCWMVMHHLDETSSKTAEEHRFKDLQSAEWGPHGSQTMCDETRHFPLKLGNKNITMGDIYEWTPKEQTSKVLLEEKIFQTWHSGRTVLLGDGKFEQRIDFSCTNMGCPILSLLISDPFPFEMVAACHKLNPMGGQGW